MGKGVLGPELEPELEMPGLITAYGALCIYGLDNAYHGCGVAGLLEMRNHMHEKLRRLSGLKCVRQLELVRGGFP